MFQALTEMVRELRSGNGQYGLVLANGGMVTYQYVVCLSSKPGSLPYPDHNPLPDLLDEPAPQVDEKAKGEAIIEVSCWAFFGIWLTQLFNRHTRSNSIVMGVLFEGTW
jgi:hypothetical protein